MEKLLLIGILISTLSLSSGMNDRISNRMIERFKGILNNDETRARLDTLTALSTDGKNTISQNTTSNYLYPSDTTYITDEFLSEKDSQTLGLIRNEIYARHGYVFRNSGYQNYFGSKEWYNPNPNFTEDLLNNVERENVKKVQEYERRIQN